MTHQITKVISAMSSMHRVKVLCRDYFYNPQNIQKILGSTMLFGCAAGYQTMEYIHQNRLVVSMISYLVGIDIFIRRVLICPFFSVLGARETLHERI